MQILPGRAYIDKPLSLPFKVTSGGWQVISIAARVKSEKQLGANKTDDEDLTIDIDGQTFPKLSQPGHLIDSPAAFSGGRQKDALKIVYFIIKLTAGDHTISLHPDINSLVESIEIFFLDQFPKVNLNLNLTAEQGDRRPFLTLVLTNAALKAFTLSATVKWHKWDGDDIQVITDGKIKTNTWSIFHRNWVFAASILKSIFGGGTQVKTFTENLDVGNHYIEVNSDQTPTVNYIHLKLAESSENGGQAILRRYNPGPQGENYNRFDSEIEEVVKKWSDDFSSQKFPPTELLDHNLVKAMIYTESYMGFGAPNGDYPAYPDVIQVADKRNPAIHTLNNDGWIDPDTHKIAREYEWQDGKTVVLDFKGQANGNTPLESINWGVRWLYHKAQGILTNGDRYWLPWSEAVKNYNKRGETAYQNKVYKIYNTGADSHGYKLWPILLFLILSVSSLIGFSNISHAQGKFYAYMEGTPNKSDQNFYIKTLDGLKEEKFLFSKFYENGGDISAFYDKHVSVRPLLLFQPGIQFLAISGWGLADYKTLAIVSYQNGHFKLIPKLNEYGQLEKNFSADDLQITASGKGVDNEIVETNILSYDNGEVQYWKNFYIYDKNLNAYKIAYKTKENGITGEEIEVRTF